MSDTAHRCWLRSRVVAGVIVLLGSSCFALAQPALSQPLATPAPAPRTAADDGFTDTPMLPGLPWHVHDPARPHPVIVTPGVTPGAAPSDAIVLFDGHDLSKWVQHATGADGNQLLDPKWPVHDGYFETGTRTGPLYTRERFGDMQLHVEWAVPSAVVGNSQGRGNSGVFVMGLYEIQVLDSYHNSTYADGQAGAVYGQWPPLVNAALKPGEWQSYDIVFEAPRFDGGKLVKPAYLTVFWNGVLIHNRRELSGPTVYRNVASYAAPHALELPLMLQDHGNPVRFRNIWVRALRQAPSLVASQLSADYEKLANRFLPVNMPFDSPGLNPRERQLVTKLAEATAQLDELFWQQSDPEGLALYRTLAGSQKPEDQALRRLLRINGGRYDLVREHEPLAGAPPHPPGANLFPADLTREEFDRYVAAHPEQKAALYDPFTVVRRKGAALEAVPYHEAYMQWLKPIVQSLRSAADLSDDAAFKRFLQMRADALLNDDYFASDIAWVDLKQPKFDLIFAPYETYLDGLLGVKTSYGAAVLVRNDAESRKLDVFQKYVPDIQQSLPLATADKPSKAGQPTPMEVMEAPLRGGDLRHGYQAVADNLPNDPRVHEQTGTKKIFFRNFMDARVQGVIIPLAQRLLNAEQALLATPEGYLNRVLMHEVAHGIGPAFARTASGKQDIRTAIGPDYSGLEEAKADIVSVYALKWLTDHGKLSATQLKEAYAAAVTDDLRSARFGTAEAHGRGSVMQFNYMVERGAITRDSAGGRYVISFERMPAVVAALARELLEQEATGDRARTAAWFDKYGKIGAELAAALGKTADVPIDVDPHADYPEL